MSSPVSLSTTAQAVLDAATNVKHPEIKAVAFQCTRLEVAAALLAAADQVVPDEPDPGESQFWDDEADREWQNNQHFRRQLLAIAAELKGADG